MSIERHRKNWEIVACETGFTLRETDSGQEMHSRIGPCPEAELIYVGQSELERRASSGRDPLVIYDIGLGIAANSTAALGKLLTLGKDRSRQVEIYSFERYPEALGEALRTRDRFPFLESYRGTLQALLGTGEWTEEGISWRLIPGDFREVSLSDFPCAELVYFDFYAPAVCPELWTSAIFSKIFGKMAGEQPLLITYASNKAIRAAMLLAGFFVGEGVSTPMKAETTLASPSFAALKSPLPPKWLERWKTSSNALPSDFSASQREQVLESLQKHPQFR